MQARALAADVVKGAIAGAIGTKALEYTVKAGWKLQGEPVKHREMRARKGEYSSEVAAEKAAELAGTELTEEQKEFGGEVMHWGLGMGAGAAYALARRKWPQVSAAQGAAFGAAFFLAVDEGVNTAFGFTPPPQDFPWQSHARGLAGHLAYGVATESALDVMDRVA